jgi:hypothetical protein
MEDSDMRHPVALKILAAVQILWLAAAPVQSMTPPSLSVNVMPRSSISGLSGLSDDRWGLGVTVWQSSRSRLRSGTRSVDNPLHEKAETLRTTLTGDFPLSRRWAAAAALPHVRTRSSFDGGGDRASGPGDALLLLKYTLFQNPAGPITREVQLLAGVELPTGKTDAKDATGANLPAPQQPGSNSTDAVVGLAGAVNLRRASLYGDATYKLAGTRAYTFGDLFALNAGVNVPFGHRARFSATSEINIEAAGRDTSSLPGPGVLPDKAVRDSGYEAVYFTPGLQWRPSRRWILSAAVQLPLHQNYRGTQLAADANWLFSFQGRWGRYGG